MTDSSSRSDVPAVLIGLDTLQGLQAARILSGHGVPVIGLASDPDHYACRTAVCQTIRICDTGHDELLAELSDLSNSFPHGGVLFPCHDHAVAHLSRNRDLLHESWRLMLPDADTVEMLMDKHRFHEFAVQHGFRVPAIFDIRQRSEIEQVAASLSYPCILKPSRRSAEWNRNTSAKGFTAEDADSLIETYDRVASWCDVIVVQQMIPGADEELYSCNCYFDRHGKPVASFTARKLRQWPPRIGSSCLGEEVRNDTVRDESLRLFAACGYRGLGYIEMKHDARTGEYFLIEANVGRPTGRSAIAEAGGVELLLAMYRDAVGEPLPGEIEQQYRGVKWWDLRHDCQSAWYYWRHGEIGFVQWVRSVSGRKAHAVFSWTDPKPFLWDFWRTFRKMITSLWPTQRTSSLAKQSGGGNGR